MKWTKTKEDGCTILRSGEYEIVQLHEGGWQLNWQGYCLNRLEAIKSMHESKEFAEEHARFN
jgi:hypothetical protein